MIPETQGPAVRGLGASGLYLYPMGLIYGADAERAVASGQAFRLGDRRAACLMAVKRRGADDQILRPADLAAYCADPSLGQGDGLALKRHLALLSAPPRHWAGFQLERPLIMGIVNVTADSFSDGGAYLETDRAVAHGEALLAAGADILDIGGESTRPGAEPVDPAIECQRVLPVIKRLLGVGAVLSIDTRRPLVMAAALEAGVRIVNDVTALADPAARALVADAGAATVLMHMRGEPGTMQHRPVYDDVVLDVYDALSAAVDRAFAAGIDPGAIMIDPGIGFGKTLDHNLAILRHLCLYRGLGCGVLIGLSRKSMIGALTGVALARDRVAGSLSGALWGVMTGADIVRVHDVDETRQALTVLRALSV